MSNDRDTFDRLLGQTVDNICQSFLDDWTHENARLSASAGLRATITREEVSKCCDWCRKLAGTYEYGTEPKDIYRRHDNCKCAVVFKRDKEPYQDAWTKKKYSTYEEARNNSGAALRISAKATSKTAVTAATRKEINVRREYLDAATPGKGTVTASAEASPHITKLAEWLHKTLGGDIKLTVDSFKWRGKSWRIVAPDNASDIEAAINSSLSSDGIVIDLSGVSSSERLKALEVANRVLAEGITKDTDVIVKIGDRLSSLVRYKK